MVRNVVVMVFFTDCNHFFKSQKHGLKKQRTQRKALLLNGIRNNQLKASVASVKTLCSLGLLAGCYIVVKQTLQLKN